MTYHYETLTFFVQSPAELTAILNDWAAKGYRLHHLFRMSLGMGRTSYEVVLEKAPAAAPPPAGKRREGK